ncbi:MAG: class I SAM-dependent methyltransferase [Deltaproteobacteria bacterium]|nr:class I SAM-dependent methyltransferase [Deltaproteobacteria bacterium]
MPAENSMQYFYEIYEAMPRQGPGDSASTRQALSHLPALTREHRILDIGCGSGAQTVDLARATEAQIVAIDNHPPFIARLVERVSELGLEERVAAQVGDMCDLRFSDGSFDALWSEGAIYFIGFAQGLAAWRRLLAPGGHLVVSELCWLRDDPAVEIVDFFEAEGADVGDLAARQKAVAASGYELVCDFVLPAFGWWENYYLPLGECLARFRSAHAGEPEALGVADRSQHEIDMYKKHADSFGYVFFVMRRD